MNKKDKVNYHCSTIQTKLSVFKGCGCSITKTINAFIYKIGHDLKKLEIEVYFPLDGTQSYRKLGAKRWKSYKRADLLIRDLYGFKLTDKVKSKYMMSTFAAGEPTAYYLVGKKAFKTKESIRNYSKGMLKFGMKNLGYIDAEGQEFFESLANSAGHDYPDRVIGKTLKVRENEYRTGLELYDEDDPELVGGISYHKMITAIPADNKIYLSRNWEALVSK